MVFLTCNPRIWEAHTGESWVEGQNELERSSASKRWRGEGKGRGERGRKGYEMFRAISFL